MLKSDFLRLEGPPLTDCYRRSVRVATAKGWDILPQQTMRRRMDEAVSAATQVLARQGIEAVRRCIRRRCATRPVWRRWRRSTPTSTSSTCSCAGPVPRARPIRSGARRWWRFRTSIPGVILAWRIDVSPNSTAVLLCAGDMIDDWGIPEHVLLDNGREFAAKSITGGASTRYRFKVKEDDIPGLFTALGCKIHWATPYSRPGQAD